MTTRANWPLWDPPIETLESIAAVIASHWNAANAYRERSFWPTATNWLRQQAESFTADEVFAARSYHFARGGKLIK
jgi:hypothetical protein